MIGSNNQASPQRVAFEVGNIINHGEHYLSGRPVIILKVSKAKFCATFRVLDIILGLFR